MSCVVQHVRIEIDAIWPDNSACVCVNTDLRKECLILKGCEYPATPADPLREINNAAGSVNEFQRDLERTQHADRDDARMHGYSNGGILSAGASAWSRRQLSSNAA